MTEPFFINYYDLMLHNLPFELMIDDESANDNLRNLLGMWSEQHRAYHNLDHLKHVLRYAEKITDERRRKLFVTASFFHDAVYDPKKRPMRSIQ